MDNVLENMVQRLRAIELVLRAQNELLTRMLAKLEHIAGSEERATSDPEALIRKRA
jgi:hypothetical protein